MKPSDKKNYNFLHIYSVLLIHEKERKKKKTQAIVTL